MKKFVLALLVGLASLCNVSNAGLMDFEVLETTGTFAQVYSLDKTPEVVTASGVIFNAYVIIGEDVTASGDLTYSIDVKNNDDDAFNFTLMAYDGSGVLASDLSTIASGGSDTLEIAVTGATDYYVGVKISDNDDSFITVDFSNYVVTPEPMTLATLGLGGLAALRRRRN